MTSIEKQKELIEIKNNIASFFTESDWIELGYCLGSYEIIQKHPRLLKSLKFEDDDYEGNILKVLSSLIEKDSENFIEIRLYLHK